MVIDVSLWIVLIPFVVVVWAFAYLLGKTIKHRRQAESRKCKNCQCAKPN